jgi:hypothetical protein
MLPAVVDYQLGKTSFTRKSKDSIVVQEGSSMRAEPRDFQCSTPTGLAEQATLDQAGVARSQVHVFAGDRIAASSISPGGDGRSAPDFAHIGESGRIGIGIGIRSIASARQILNKFRVSAKLRWASIAGAIVVAFGLGWACASMFNSNSGASLAALDQKADMSLGRLDSEKQPVRRNHGVAKTTAAKPAPAESNKPRLPALPASARLSSSPPAQIHSEPQSIILESMERISPPRTLSVSSDTNLPLRLSPVPETKPTTIAGWTVREVDGETAVLVGPDHVFTVRTGDTVAGVGRIDSIVRWGNRWIVATSAGLISTE